MMPTSPRRRDEQPEYDLLVVGGGPAALSAAFYARTKQLNVVMLYEELGGKLGWRQRFAGPYEERSAGGLGRRQLAAALSRDLLDLEDEYLPGNEVVRLLISRTVMQAGQVIHDRALKVAVRDDSFHVETQKHGVLKSAVVLVATGASPLRLNVPGAQRLAGQQLGYSIRTYAHLVAGKRVAVIGATQRALRGAAELARTATRVYLIAPEDESGALSAKAPLIGALRRQPNIEVLAGHEVKEVIGAAGIKALIVEHAGQTRRIDVDRAFVDLGLVPHSDLVQGLVATDPDGFIVVDDCNATTMPGLFAAGDVTTAFCEQVLVAVGDGARAAMHAYDYLLACWVGPVSRVACA